MLGTSSWYFGEGYVTNMYVNTLTANSNATIYGTTSLGSTLYMNGRTINLGGKGTNLIHATNTDAAYGYGGGYNNIAIEA